ncbi:hypothetical protein GUJ93_ZPchr0003g17944 [Zizania palustris]|uniref:Ubiquinone biosynthesis monooxygenase COQ6, mitochondrial n=1 Tax=Zizania palustris TaxID=103762 RepID=A0A8J5STU5_ZIZPA|nr:hypothetical protein GUJ93_ZPchr0003g17944 [Zizania palustris]
MYVEIGETRVRFHRAQAPPDLCRRAPLQGQSVTEWTKTKPGAGTRVLAPDGSPPPPPMTPACASAFSTLLSRGRCFPAASRIRPLARAFCDAPPRLQDAAAGMACSQDHTEKVDDVKARPDELDIAIVGGGMVGLAVACALFNMPLTKHLRVGIIDSNPALKSRNYLKKDSTPDSRVSTITPATISFFKDIGAWEHVQQQRHAFFGKMQVMIYLLVMMK